MTALILTILGFLLVAHGMVHLLYLSEDTPEFSLEDSWLVPDSASRPVAVALMAATVAAFTLSGIAVWGMPGLAGAWWAIAIGAAMLSLALLVTFWSRSLVFGVLIDLALVAVAVIRPEWTDRIGG